MKRILLLCISLLAFTIQAEDAKPLASAAQKTALINAVKTNNILQVTDILHQCAFIPSDKNIIFMLATHMGFVDILKVLLENNFDINAKDKWGNTALITASINGRIEIVQLLLDHGANISIPDATGTTALELATLNDLTNIINVFKAAGEKQTSINQEAASPEAEIIKMDDVPTLPLQANPLQDVFLGENVIVIQETNKNETTEKVTLVLHEHDQQQKASAPVEVLAKANVGLVIVPLANAANTNSNDMVEKTTLDYAHDTSLINSINLSEQEEAEQAVARAKAEEETKDPKIRELKELQAKVASIVQRNASQDEKNNALVQTSSLGLLEEVKILLSHGAQVNARGTDGNTALIDASTNGQTEVVRLLLQQPGIDPDAKSRVDRKTIPGSRTKSTQGGYTSLMLASINGHTAIVKLLLQHGVNLNLKDECCLTSPSPSSVKTVSGKTALEYANISGNQEIIDAFNAGIAKRNELITAAKKGDIAIVKSLVHHIDQHEKNTVFKQATTHGHKNIVTLMLPFVDATIINFELAEAAARGNLEIVKLLLAHGANVNAKNSYPWGLTALELACQGGHIDIVKLLLKHKADVNGPIMHIKGKRKREGITALMLASKSGHIAIVRLLLEYKADVNIEEMAWSKTALQFASENGHQKIVELLKKFGAQ